MSSDTNRITKKKKVSALKIVNDDPKLASVVTKLITDKKRPRDLKGKKRLESYSRSKLEAVSSSIKSRINNIDSILQLFPDIELAIQILVSSILSPKNMVSTDLIFKVDANIFPTDTLMVMLDTLKKYVEKEYKIKSKLPTIIRNVLFNTGSYPVAILPESSLDEIINKGVAISKEDLNDFISADGIPTPMGFLGSRVERKNNVIKEKTGIGMESFTTTDGNYSVYKAKLGFPKQLNKETKDSTELNFSIEVYDNYEMLKFPMLIEANKKAHIRKKIRENSLGLEEFDYKELFLDDNLEPREQVNINVGSKNKRKSINKPLVMQLPSEAVIPVHVPGDPQDHLGYFVLIDEHGNPITKSTKSGSDAQGLQKLVEEGQNSVGSYLIEKARSNLTGNANKNEVGLDDLTLIFGEIVENDLKDRLKNGIYGDNVEVTATDDIYRVMLYRSLSNHSTRLLYIPEELVTYFAYKYYSNGTGKSLMDDLLIITSLRAIMLFSKVMATVKNSISVTTVNLKLDEHDPDPMKTIEKVMSEVLLTRQQYLPVGINNPNDLVDWIHRAGFEFTFEGHPGIPDVQLEFDTKKMDHQVPDEELDELLRKQTIMTLGLNPEIVDNSYSADFATTIVANNLLLSKRILQIQEIFNPKIGDFIKKISLNDSLLIDQLKEIVANDRKLIKKKLKEKFDNDDRLFSKKEDILDSWLVDFFINHIEVELPKPDMTTIENMKEAYTSYSEALEEALEAWINNEALDMTIAGDMSDYMEPVKAIVKSHFLRKWMAENNYMPELAAITTEDDGGKPAMNIYDLNKDHLEALMKSAMGFIKKSSKFKAKYDEQIANLDNDEEEESDTSDSGDNPFGDNEPDNTFDETSDVEEGNDLETPEDENTNLENPDELEEETLDETPKDLEATEEEPEEEPPLEE